MKYSVVVCDPPWAFDDKLKKMKKRVHRSADSQYSTMSEKEIMNLDVKSIADELGCLLALWVPSSYLPVGLQVISAWGFTYKQMFIWNKMQNGYRAKDYSKEDLNLATRVGMGRIFRNSHEVALIGVMGSVQKKIVDRSQRTVSFDINVRHSVKPDTLQQRLDKTFGDVPKLEMFARRVLPSWTCVGNECPDTRDEDIRDSLKRLVLL